MTTQHAVDTINVVVVEDEALIRSELVEAFPFYGFHVFAAEDATEAVRILREEAPRIQLVFTDVHLPSPMNGLMLGHHIRQNWPWIAVLVTSGYGTPDAAHMPEGCRFVLKPYKISKIAEQIKELVQAH